MTKLFTIGYEGTDLPEFLATLKRARASVLLDVRELPISRRKGFSKTVLQRALAEVGIAYRHEKRLGSPKAVRYELRENWDYKRFFLKFSQHLRRQDDLLGLLAEELKGNVVLMCYERDHTTCHRRAVVDDLAHRMDLEPIHLTVGAENECREARKTPHPHLGKSLSAA
jgi:uncharacterized protein (DUF488 family)